MDDVFTSADIVSAIMTGDNSRAKEGILGVLGQRSMDELEVRKVEVAQGLFKDTVPEEPEEIVSDSDEIDQVDPKDLAGMGHGGDQIQVVDPFDGQPTETLQEPLSASA
tara:strand:- start:883 stop:1209 length:327 start_codon:yes stop_codon:yes gene_type:complete